MSTHNIGFYEDLTKINFELSSNAHLISSAETAPLIMYGQICIVCQDQSIQIFRIFMSLVVRKPVFGVSDQVRHKPGCRATQDGQRLEILYSERRGIVLSM